MKSTIGNKLRSGIFIVISVGIFIITIFYVGQRRRLFSASITISAVFNNISGLQVGNNVRFAGIDVGTVDNIEIFADTMVRVDMLIDKNTAKFISKNAKASIGTEGLMGNRVVNIFPEAKAKVRVHNGDFIKSSNPINFDQVIQQLEKTLKHGEEITGNVAVITNKIQSGKGLIGKIFMDTNFAKEVTLTLRNVKQGTEEIKEDAEAAKHNVLLRGYFKKQAKKNKN